MRQGGLRDAILHSAGANAAHGLRRTNADKRRAVLMLLEDGEWSQWSDREIGRQCVVDHKTVTRLREEHLGKSPDAPRTVSRGGKVYTMKPRVSRAIRGFNKRMSYQPFRASINSPAGAINDPASVVQAPSP